MNSALLHSRPYLPLLAAGLTIVVWSSAFSSFAYGLQAFSPAELALFRFAIASTVLLVPVSLGWIKLPPRRDWPAVIVLGLLGMTIYQLAFGYALTRVAAGAVAVVLALAPGVTAALAALRLGEPLSARMVTGLIVAFAGTLLVTLGSGRAMQFEPMVLLVLVSVLATSIYFVWQKPLLARTTPLGFTAASIFAGTLGLLPFGLHLPEKLLLASTPQLLSALYLGIAPTVLGYLLWNWALSRAPASTVTSFLYAQPLLASVIAWLWLGQTLSALAIAGGAVAISGVVLTIRGNTTPAKPRLPAPSAASVCECTR